MKKFYYYMYYRIYHFAIKISDDALNEIKPGALIVALEALLIFQFFVWYSVFQHRFIELSGGKLTLLLLIAVIIVFNYFVFLYQDKWKQYNKEFSSYDKKKKIWLGIMILLIIFIVIGSLIFSFYKLSQMKHPIAR